MGFLSERPRMNVLLSRAKWKVVIVTSLEFLRVQSRRYTGKHVPDDGDFLRTFLATLDRLQTEKLADGTAKATVVPVDTLMGRRS
jgi:hypothetical protein